MAVATTTTYLLSAHGEHDDLSSWYYLAPQHKVEQLSDFWLLLIYQSTS